MWHVIETMHPPDADQVLLQQIADGDMAALEVLYGKYGLKVLRYLIGLLEDHGLAEEVLQDVMVIAWQSAQRFRGGSNVLTWLLAIAHHRALKVRRRRTLQQADLNDATTANDLTPAELLEGDMERQQLTAALLALPTKQRETLELVFYHELSGVEAAQVLGVASGTIKSRLHRALVTLRRVLSVKDAHYD